jgi:hypothetical protein
MDFHKKAKQKIYRLNSCARLRRIFKMSIRDFGQEILDGIREIKAFKADQVNLRTHLLKEPASPQVIRAKLKLSQSAFAGLMGVSLITAPAPITDPCPMLIPTVTVTRATIQTSSPSVIGA